MCKPAFPSMTEGVPCLCVYMCKTASPFEREGTPPIPLLCMNKPVFCTCQSLKDRGQFSAYIKESASPLPCATGKCTKLKLIKIHTDMHTYIHMHIHIFVHVVLPLPLSLV